MVAQSTTARLLFMGAFRFLARTLRSSLVFGACGIAMCVAIPPLPAQTEAIPTPQSPAQLGLPQVSVELPNLPMPDATPPVRLLAPSIVVVQTEKKPDTKAAEKKAATPEGKEAAIRISTQPPSQDELFRLDTELQLRERILQEAQKAGVKLEMTEFGSVTQEPMPSGRDLPEQYSTYLPSTLCYGRLFFEQRASERFGRSVWGVQPAISVGRFYFDLACWPVRLATWPVRPMDCNDDAGFVWERVASPRHPWWLW